MGKKESKAKVKHLKKISVRTVCGPTRVKSLPEDGSALELMRVAGTAYSEKTGETEKGPWRAFVGSFVAVNKRTGEIFRASRLFLPAELDEEVGAALQAGGPAEIKADISVRYDESSPVSYSYVCSNLVAGGGVTDDEAIALLD